VHGSKRITNSSACVLCNSISLLTTILLLVLSCTVAAVVDRLVHPLSPRGKLVHWGLEGLAECNKLIGKACRRVDDDPQIDDDSRIILRDELYRLALTQEQTKQLQRTADLLPDMAQWLSSDEIRSVCPYAPDDGVASLGGLRLYNGCKVIHVPSYLKGLWSACERRATETGNAATWAVVSGNEQQHNESTMKWHKRLRQDFDDVVLAAGSGIFFSGSNGGDGFCSADSLPVQLVGGQSVELRLTEDTSGFIKHALLCGKYISPMPSKELVLVGGTHEFSKELMSEEQVVSELKQRTYKVCPGIWEHGTVKKITEGVRVQAKRGRYGRRPIVGRLPDHDDFDDRTSLAQGATWIFTGLSSRGLLYHGLYGSILAEAILQGSELPLLSRCEDILWWRR